MAELNRLFELLCDADIDFVIVGGFAAMLHGSSLVTRDLDVCAILTPETVAKLRAALAPLKPVHRLTPQKLSFLDDRVPDSGTKNLYLETELGPVDVLGEILGIGGFDRVRESSVEVELFGRTCRVLSLEALIRAKDALGRDKDRLAAIELRAIAAKQSRRE